MYVTTRASAAAYNQRIQPEPTAILYPSSQQEIAQALSCASHAGVKVSARGGGHSYASYGLGSGDGALVIDLGNFRDIKVDGSGRASIGAGNRLGDIYLALNDQGWAIAAGVCEAVGIGGHAGFGGAPSRVALGTDFLLSGQRLTSRYRRVWPAESHVGSCE